MSGKSEEVNKGVKPEQNPSVYYMPGTILSDLLNELI